MDSPGRAIDEAKPCFAWWHVVNGEEPWRGGSRRAIVEVVVRVMAEECATGKIGRGFFGIVAGIAQYRVAFRDYRPDECFLLPLALQIGEIGL